MYNLMGCIAEVLMVCFQAYCMQHFYRAFMKTRLDWCVGNQYFIAVFWIFLHFLLAYLWPGNYENTRTQGKTLVTIALVVIITLWLYDAGNAIKIFAAVTFLSVNEICVLLSAMVLEIGSRVFSLWNWCFDNEYITSADTFLFLIHTTAIGLQFLFTLLFMLLLYMSLKAILRNFKEKNYPIRKSELLFILIPGMVSLILCLLLRMIMITVENNIPLTLYDRYPMMMVLVPVALLLALVSIISAIKAFQNMIILNREKSNRIVLEKQVDGLQEHIQEMDRINLGLRSIRHDIKNQMAVIMRLAGSPEGSGEIPLYLAEMQRTLEQLAPHFTTGNTVVDTILNMKYHEACRRVPEISITMGDMLIPSDFGISSYDIGIILSNALDNAIEACEKIVKGERFIRISSFSRGKMLFLEIENSFEGHLLRGRQDEFPQTDKEDRENHGIGLYNIKNSAEKYQGAVDWFVERNVFTLSVMMKMKQQQQE